MWLTALQPSVKEDDVRLEAVVDGAAQPAGKGNLTNEQVTFADHIKNADTPEGMKDRIPPRVVTNTTVKMKVTLDKGQKIVFAVRSDNLGVRRSLYVRQPWQT